MSAANLLSPEFKTEGMFSVVLKRPKSSGKSSSTDWGKVKKMLQHKSESKLSKSALKILEMVYYSSEVTIPEMAKELNITERAIEKNLQKLKENQLLERKESTRAGFWQLMIDLKSFQ